MKPPSRKMGPRILPLVGVAMVGVLAVNAAGGARDLPGLLTGARAYAEGVAPTSKAGPAPKAAAADSKGKDAAAVALPPSTLQARAVCAPTAAELAKEAGLSPAELQVLQSLGARRGQLDAREGELDTQLALIAAAEAKLDAKVKALTVLKFDIQNLVTTANAREAAEIDRLVRIFEGMKAKDAAPRLAALDDKVRIPIAAKLKDRALSAILSQMPAPEAKKLTELLAQRYSDAQAKAAEAQAALAAPPATAPAATPVQKAAAKPAPRKKAPASKQAAAKATEKGAAIPAAATPYTPPAATPPPAKAG